MRGRLAVSAMKPAAITKAIVDFFPNPSDASIAITIGVRMSAAPSFAKSAATAAPRRTMSVKSRTPRPPPQRATWSAAHSKNPEASRRRLMRITATKAPVAFQTICHTVWMSLRCTTPMRSARTAPSDALQPIPRPRGCQITRVSVRIKIARAGSMVGPGFRRHQTA